MLSPPPFPHLSPTSPPYKQFVISHDRMLLRNLGKITFQRTKRITIQAVIHGTWGKSLEVPVTLKYLFMFCTKQVLQNKQFATSKDAIEDRRLEYIFFVI